jgi:erythromycin esterase-like protein
MSARSWRPTRGTVRGGSCASARLDEIYAGPLQAAGRADGLLVLRNATDIETRLLARRQQRAVGVIYRTDAELLSHYFSAMLSKQFDAVVYIARTRALTPLV